MKAEICELAPKEWDVLPIEEVCTRVTSGGTPSRKVGAYFSGGSWPWVKTQELLDGWIDDTEEHITDEAIESSSAKVLPPNTLLLALYGATVGQLGLLRRPMTCNQACCAMIVDEGRAHFRYLYYQLLHHRRQLKHLATGAAQQNLSGALMKSFALPFPEVAEQQAIGRLLGALDDKIEHNRKTSRALEGLARAMFKAWFVDFEPVHAKAAGATSFPGMPPEAFAALPTRFSNSELGQVPEGWKVVDVYAFAKVVYGAPFKSKLFNEQGIGTRLIRIRDLQTHLPTVFTPELHPKGTLIRPGDIIVGMDGEFRLHYWTGPEAWLNQRLCSFSPLPGVPAVYLGEALRSPLNYVERSEAATTVIHLGKYDIDRFELLRPSEPVLAAFGAVTTPMLDAIVHLAAESRKLAELRDYLLPKLLSGEVRVRSPDILRPGPLQEAT